MMFMSIENIPFGGELAPSDDEMKMLTAGADLAATVKAGGRFEGLVPSVDGDVAVLTLPGETPRDEPVTQVRLVPSESGALTHVREFHPTETGRIIVERQYGTDRRETEYRRVMWDEDRTLAGYEEIRGSRSVLDEWPLIAEDCQNVMTNIIEAVQDRAVL